MVFILRTIKLYSTLKVSGATYTENGVHKCAPAPTPSSSTLVCDLKDEPEYNTFVPLTLRPKNGQVFSRIEIPAPYYFSGSTRYEYDLMDPGTKQPCFMTFEMRDKQNTFNTFYCWIDSITPKIEKATRSSYIIDFHVDWWLTAGNQATFGTGRMLRGPSSYARPDPSEPRRWLYANGTKLDLVLTDDGLTRTQGSVSDPWVIVAHTVKLTVNQKTYTSITYKFWQPDVVYTWSGYSRWGPGWPTVFNGYMDEMLEIDPDSIIGCWISPIPPTRGYGMLNDRVDGTQTNGLGYWTFTTGLVANTVEHTLKTYGSKQKTDDLKKWIVTDPYGNIMATLPWGIEWDTVYAGLDLSTAGPNLVLSFNNSSNSPVMRIGEGRTVTIPLMEIPITSNAWSSYNYSGEREYDRTMRHIQQEQAAASGVSGAAQGAIQGALTGAIVGSAGGPIGAGAGAGIGLATSLMGAAASYSITGHYDRKTQEAVDRFKSNQTSNVILYGGGVAWMKMNNVFNPAYALCTLTRDSVSAAELTAEQSELGYLTDTQVANCSTLIAAKGPLKIEGLEVSGLLPEGNRYISQMFARGVHLD